MSHMPDGPDSLAALEGQKAALLRKISQLGDFRPGSVTTTTGRPLPLLPPPGSRARTQFSADLQREGQDGDRVLCLSGRTPQNRARD